MSFEQFASFLNLPIFGGVVYIIFRAGTVARQLKDIERRLAFLEDHVWGGRRSRPRDDNGD